MKNYEILSESCKLCWIDNFEIKGEKYTQVSGYVFNDNNQLLIVKSGKTWTVPGGHPEKGETQIQTLEREIMEEACVTIKDIIENGETYYQLRYTAKVKDILPFKGEWETEERLFVDLNDLANYIKWCKGITFSQQIEASKKVWEIK